MGSATQTVLHMNQGDGEKSYAKNSIIQMEVMNKTLPVIKDIIRNMFVSQLSSFEVIESFRIADLGCASGPNTLVFMSEIIDIIYKLSNENNNKAPEILMVLNDLHKNDFNNIFIALPSFYEQLKEKYGHEFSQKCFINGTPASFHGRLLPRKSLHFVHSSYSLHWLSQVPENLDNKGHIYIEKTCHRNVFIAYKNQFHKDFTSFLNNRSYELIPMGRMILTFIGRRIPDPLIDHDSWCIYELLAESLLDQVSEGLIKEEDVDSFNLPLYHPYKDEVKAIIEKEKSFYLENLHVFECNWNPDDIKLVGYEYNRKRSGKYLSNGIRSITEPLLISHFRGIDLDYVFKRYKERADNHLNTGKTTYINIMICLRKK